MSKGIVYILTNPCLDGWVKIGKTDRSNISGRLSELNAPSNIPLSYRAYALYHVENPAAVEESIHAIFDHIDANLHAREEVNGRIREREFFKVSPEAAHSVFVEIAKLRGDREHLELVTLTGEQQEEEELQGRATPFRFNMVDIPPGAELEYTDNADILCTVVDNRNVCYDGVSYSISGLVQKLKGCSYMPQGTLYFKYEGETLDERRKRMVGDRR